MENKLKSCAVKRTSLNEDLNKYVILYFNGDIETIFEEFEFTCTCFSCFIINIVIILSHIHQS